MQQPLAWDSDYVQASAYAVVIEEMLNEPVPEARIRYHRDNVTVRIPIDSSARAAVRDAVKRARELRRNDLRPPVTENARLCNTCSLAPVCLPEEERGSPVQLQLFPPRRQGETLHVISPKARVGRSNQTIVVTIDDEEQRIPIEDLDAVIIHGSGQITTQAVHLCSARGIPIQWFSHGGRFLAGTESISGRVRQRIRQFTALTDPAIRLRLTRATVTAKVESQLRYLLRATRGNEQQRGETDASILQMRGSLQRLASAESIDAIRGLEGLAARAWFAAIPHILSSQVSKDLIPHGRTRHPPKDRLNCLLSYGYSLLFGFVHRCLLSVGLEPAFGYFHQPRSAAPPLVMDVMEIFRVLLWDMPLIGSVNRGSWNSACLFNETKASIWLSDSGRKQAIELFETRLSECFRHPHTGNSIEYGRIVELECRLLEKEWSGYPGEFAQMRLR